MSIHINFIKLKLLLILFEIIVLFKLIQAFFKKKSKTIFLLKLHMILWYLIQL